MGVLWHCPGGGFEVALAGPHPWSHQQWEGRAGSDDDDDGSDGDGTVIVVPLECSVGLSTSIASRAAWWPFLEAVSVVAAHDDRRKNLCRVTTDDMEALRGDC